MENVESCRVRGRLLGCEILAKLRLKPTSEGACGAAGSTCPALGPALLAAGESCDAVMNFRPSDFFAGEDQLAELTATAYDPETGAVLDTLVIQFFARGRA